VRIKNGTSKKAGILEIKKDEWKPVDADKFVTNEPAYIKTFYPLRCEM
jgi:hypothetical protein